jgi:hypothetical protein
MDCREATRMGPDGSTTLCPACLARRVVRDTASCALLLALIAGAWSLV